MKATLLLLLVLPAAAETVAVGSCEPHLVSYRTISTAVSAAAPNSTVLICPGTYPEQVVVNQPLTLQGVNQGTPGGIPVVAVPSGGKLVADSFGNAAQISVEASAGTVNISNIAVNGQGASFDCSTGGSLVGIRYTYASGSLAQVNTTNQSPGGCGIGIWLVGNPFVVDTVNIRQSTATNFDMTGIYATYVDFFESKNGFLVNLTNSFIYSTSTSVKAGVDYEGAFGVISHNTITVAGQFGLDMFAFFPVLTAQGNTVTMTGSGTGISAGTDLGGLADVIGNSVIGGGTGIAVPLGSGTLIERNTVAGSTVQAINEDCSELVIARNNVILDVPVGFANAGAAIPVGNVFSNVPVPYSPVCF